MKEINISKTLVAKRREKGVTQDELAEYIGVSKASVSKWETGQSYPDITFLPQLAAYFNISIDELIGYAPQLTKKDIRKLYHKLSSRFATEPFHDVMDECRKLIKKYYSCFPMLFQMAALLVNHHMLAESQEQKEAVLREAVNLCVRIKTEGGEALLAKDAVLLQATCCFMLQEPQSILDLLGETVRLNCSTAEELISQAYQLLGNISKAKEVTQISMYKHLMSSFSAMPSYLLLNADNIVKAEEILRRALSLSDIYNMEVLNPNVLIQLYAAAAQVYCMNGNAEGALEMLSRYSDVCTRSFFPFKWHGDKFFDSIDDCFDDFDLDNTAPRDERVIKESMIQEITNNPAYAILSELSQYKSIIEGLKFKLGVS